MTKVIIILTSFILLYFNSYGQTDNEELELYKKAYNYLNTSINIDPKTFKEDCSSIVTGKKVKIKPKLQVAEKFIKNDSQFPMCDLLTKKYGLSDPCLQLYSTKEYQQAEDSLNIFWTDYSPITKEQLKKKLSSMISKRKDGYQVFFSDIYKNTLAAEVKSFCLPYDYNYWQGSSTSYYFVFNEKSELIEVYSGIMIHYN